MTKEHDISSSVDIAEKDALNIDDIIDYSLSIFNDLPQSYNIFKNPLEDIKKRLGRGELRIAVMGQFKRGKSSFINCLLGFDLLPVSVVPLTSIPTFIRHGIQTKCYICFYNGKPDIVVKSSCEDIKATLIEYTTEEKNPKNKFCVSKAIVEFDNPILENGTIIIDTPGFGSTYVHNTKTSLDFIKGCDAVLFLLSADPPFTQTEVEFLKEVKQHVSRIFFIINKTDQLNQEELSKLDSFIKKILEANNFFTSDKNIFHVSAKIALKKQDKENKISSGIEKIKTHIIDFLAKEKYFALSLAVSEKLKTTIKAILFHLSKDAANIQEQLNEKQKQYEWLQENSIKIKEKSIKEDLLIGEEIKALSGFVDKTLNMKKQEFFCNIQKNTENLIESAINQKANPISVVKSAFGNLADEMIMHIYLQINKEIERPLKKAVEIPYKEFLISVEDAKDKICLDKIDIQEIKNISVNTELPAFDSSFSKEMQNIFNNVKKIPFLFFKSKEKRKELYIQMILPQIKDIATRQYDMLSIHLKNSIRKICETCREDLKKRYESLSNAIQEALNKIKNNEKEIFEQKQKQIDFFKTKQEEFLKITEKII
jgi:predicted GTPase